MNLLMDVKQTAEALSVSEWTIRHLLRTKQLSKVKIGARVLIDNNELIRFIQEHKK